MPCTDIKISMAVQQIHSFALQILRNVISFKWMYFFRRFFSHFRGTSYAIITFLAWLGQLYFYDSYRIFYLRCHIFQREMHYFTENPIRTSWKHNIHHCFHKNWIHQSQYSSIFHRHRIKPCHRNTQHFPPTATSTGALSHLINVDTAYPLAIRMPIWKAS